MVEEKEVKQQGIKAMTVLFSPIIMLGMGLAVFLFFKDEIASILDFTNMVEAHQVKITKLENAIENRSVFMSQTNQDVLILKDFKDDITDELARRKVDIDQNTNERNNQIIRATARIEQHKYTLQRLIKLESFIDEYRYYIIKMSETQCLK